MAKHNQGRLDNLSETEKIYWAAVLDTRAWVKLYNRKKNGLFHPRLRVHVKPNDLALMSIADCLGGHLVPKRTNFLKAGYVWELNYSPAQQVIRVLWQYMHQHDDAVADILEWVDSDTRLDVGASRYTASDVQALVDTANNTPQLKCSPDLDRLLEWKTRAKTKPIEQASVVRPICTETETEDVAELKQRLRRGPQFHESSLEQMKKQKDSQFDSIYGSLLQTDKK